MSKSCGRQKEVYTKKYYLGLTHSQIVYGKTVETPEPYYQDYMDKFINFYTIVPSKNIIVNKIK